MQADGKDSDHSLTEAELAIELLRSYGFKLGRDKETRGLAQKVLDRYRQNRTYLYGKTLLENVRNLSIDCPIRKPNYRDPFDCLTALLEQSSVLSIPTDIDEFVKEKCLQLIADIEEQFGRKVEYDSALSSEENYKRLLDTSFHEATANAKL